MRIFERFELSSQYTPETFLENYSDSLFNELKSFHPVIYALVKNGEFSFPSANEVTLTMEESIVAPPEPTAELLSEPERERPPASIKNDCIN